MQSIDNQPPAPHRQGPSIRLVMLGFALALLCVVGAGALLHPRPASTMVASNATGLR